MVVVVSTSRSVGCGGFVLFCFVFFFFFLSDRMRKGQRAREATKERESRIVNVFYAAV